MNQFWRHLLIGLTLCSAQVQADNSSYFFEPTPEHEETRRPFNLDIQYDHITKAKFKAHDYRGQRVGYDYGQVNGGYVFYYDGNIEEGAFANVQYSRTRLRWKQNPFFSQDHFDAFTVGIGGFSNRLYNWEWKGQLNVNFDINHFEWLDYTTYDMFVWGRYLYSDCVGLHMGVLAQTGMKIDWVYPILGIDWRISPRWKLNLVFPLNVSLVYHLTDRWSLTIEGRAINSRHRLSKNAPLSKGLWTYKQVGTECGLHYVHCGWLNLNLHVGHTLQGKLKVANRHYRQKHHLRFDGAFYLGGEASVKF